MRLSGTKQNAEKSMASSPKLPLGVTSRDVTYACSVFFSQKTAAVPKGL